MASILQSLAERLSALSIIPDTGSEGAPSIRSYAFKPKGGNDAAVKLVLVVAEEDRDIGKASALAKTLGFKDMRAAEEDYIKEIVGEGKATGGSPLWAQFRPGFFWPACCQDSHSLARQLHKRMTRTDARCSLVAFFRALSVAFLIMLLVLHLPGLQLLQSPRSRSPNRTPQASSSCSLTLSQSSQRASASPARLSRLQTC